MPSITTEPTRADEWRAALAGAFNGLSPAGADPSAAGRITGAADLGDVGVWTVTGNPQTLIRTSRQRRSLPTDYLKVCIQRRGRATIQQAEREVVLEPGGMALYDISIPYALRLEGAWCCEVIAFPRAALPLAERSLADAMRHAAVASSGPGAVLSQLVGTVLETRTSGIEHLAHAGVSLVAAAVAGPAPVAADPDALRLQITAFVRDHLADPALDHGAVATAHHLSPRSLHRLFEDQPRTVSQLIRSLRLDGLRRDLSSAAHAGESISAIAARWGLYDMAQLSRTFRAAFGERPSDTRPRR